MIKWCSALGLAIFVVFSSVYFGAAELSTQQVWSCLLGACDTPVHRTIIWDIRIPRILVGFLVGAGLAIAGAVLQTLTRNSLADPYLFGVVSGAGLGASIVTVSPSMMQWLPELYTLPLGAFIGALIAVLTVQGFIIRSYGSRTEKLLLAGVAVSFMFGAATHWVLYLAEPFAANSVVFWLLGSLARSEYGYLALLFPVVAVSFIFLYVLGPRIDALLLGDDTARSLGVNVQVLRYGLLMLCALLTACIVAFCGGIGFVGLMIPHIVRTFLGVTSRAVLLGSVCAGGSFLVVADTLARALFADHELPIGVITAAVGSVFFLLVMRRIH